MSDTSSMQDDYDKALQAVRQLRELGAVHVQVGPVSATFATPYLPEPDEEAPDPGAFERAKDEVRKRLEAEQYWSAPGV